MSIFDERVRRNRELLESTPRSVKVGHSGYDPTMPPPDVIKVEAKTPTLAERIKPHGQFWSDVRSIGMGVAFAGAAIYVAFSWSVNRAVDERFDELYRRLDPSVLKPTTEQLKQLDAEHKPIPLSIGERFDAQATAIAKVQTAVDAPGNPLSAVGKRLDSFDRAVQRAFPSRPNRPALPTIGPSNGQSKEAP